MNVKKTKSSKKIILKITMSMTVERIDKVTNCWRSTGHLMGPANIGDGYILEVQIPLSGEEGDFVLGQMDRTGEASDSGSDAW